MRVYTVSRPYVLLPGSFVLSSIEAQRLIDAGSIVLASRDRVALSVSGQRAILRAATYGAGPAFVIERRKSGGGK